MVHQGIVDTIEKPQIENMNLSARTVREKLGINATNLENLREEMSK